MISFHLQTSDLENIRFAYSPLLEVSMSYRALRFPERYTLNQRWLDEAHRTLQGVEFPYLDALVTSRYTADFITPPPVAKLTLDEEIEQLRARPVELIRANVRVVIEKDGETAIRRQFLAFPYESLECLIEEIRFYWRQVLAHHWGRITSVLDNDVLYHAREMALHGVDALLDNLHPLLSYANGELRLKKSHCSPRDPASHWLKGEGLLLVPGAFTVPDLSWQVGEPWTPMFIYGARGTGLWYQPDLPDPEKALEVALGPGKARLLYSLKTPGNTSELALRLDVTAGAISQHLNRLNEAGLVESHRSRNKVYYRLTARGEKLLGLFSE